MEIKRDAYLQQLIERKDNGMIKVITGIRRCGKSFLLFTKVGRESQETFCNYRTMMSNFVEMLYRQQLVLSLCPCVLYDILFISTKNIYSYSQLKEGTYAYGTASVKNI